jgi:RNA polymerase sigma-70 factor (sigma-E family)
VGTTRDEVQSFVVTHNQTLMRLAWVLTGEQQRAEDLVQSTLLKTWSSWSRVQAADDRLAYVRRILINAHIAHSRRRWSGEIPSASLPEITDSEPMREVEALRSILSTLTPRQRAAVALRFVDDLDDATIAEALGCSVQTVRSQISKALSRLRASMAAEPLGGSR